MIQRSFVVHLLASLIVPCVSGSLAASECPTGNLLEGLEPLDAPPIVHLDRLADGIVVAEGGDWESTTSAMVLRDEPLVFDLGRVLPVRAVFVQGDHAGSYRFEGSRDGRVWYPIWSSPGSEHRGMRRRYQDGIDVEARFLRLLAPREGSAYAISELCVYCTRPFVWPPELRVEPNSGDRTLLGDWWSDRATVEVHRMMIGLLGLVAFVALFLADGVAPSTRTRWALLTLFGATTSYLALVISIGGAEGELVDRWLQGGAVVLFAILPAVLVARGGVARARAALLASGGAMLYATLVATAYDQHSFWVPLVALVLWAAVGFAAWTGNGAQWARTASLLMISIGGIYGMAFFGAHFRVQGLVAGSGAGAPVNTANDWGRVGLPDQFHYFMGAKYFPEIGYKKLYDCMAVAEIENGRGNFVAEGRVRDLESNLLVSGARYLEKETTCREAFSAARWDAFRRDAFYFSSRVERRGRLLYLTDHGFNATPSWIALNHWIVSRMAASDASLGGLMLVDVALLSVAFGVVWWAFGLEASALMALVWGVSTIWIFYNVGSFGSFGRFYYLCAAVLSLCLLKKGYYAWGGAMLSVSMLFRVFPGAMFVGPAIVMAAAVLRGRWPAASLVHMTLGAAASAAILSGITVYSLGGVRTYQQFIENSVKHVGTPLQNYMGLKTLFSFSPSQYRMEFPSDEDPRAKWKAARRETFESRRLIYAVTALGLLGIYGYASIVMKDPWKLVATGILPVFCLFEVTSYYYALLVLLAPLVLVARERLLALAVYIGLVLSGQVIERLTSQTRGPLGLDTLTYPIFSGLVLGVLLFFLWGEVYPRAAKS